MSYLVDTNVVSEIRKRDRMNSGVRGWLATLDDNDFFLSVLAIGELRRGLERIRRRDLVAAERLETWLDGLIGTYGGQILPVTTEIADRWGRLGVPNPIPAIDGLLAATALVHDLTLVTRNEKDVASTGVSVLNPFV